MGEACAEMFLRVVRPIPAFREKYLMAARFISGETVVSSKDAISCDLKGEVIILHVSSGVYFGLEGVSADIWQFIQKPCKLSEVIDNLTSRFEVDPDVCAGQTMAFIEELAQHGLVIIRKNDDGS
jgi:hypothetical protein